MTPFYKHDFSVENRHEILGETDKKLTQEMYCNSKSVEVRAVFNTKKAKVMVRPPLQPRKIKMIITLKPKLFSGDRDGNVQKLMARLSQKIYIRVYREGIWSCLIEVTDF